MTYNVHSCIGTDGRMSIQRIVQVIAQHSPDIIALQELDMGHQRTGGHNQPEIIARQLGMHYHFLPLIGREHAWYGIAVLSRYPLTPVKAGLLPQPVRDRWREMRGALWLTAAVAGVTLNIFNTHLGLTRRERLMQAQALLGPDWLGHPRCSGPVIMCGDLNAWPGTRTYRLFARCLRDVQKSLPGRRARKTWPVYYPLLRIDHIFTAHTCEITHFTVGAGALARQASDHLPLTAVLTRKSLHTAGRKTKN